MDILLKDHQYELLREGAWITIQVLGLSFVLGVILSLVLGVARLSERQWVRGIALAFVEFARGISSIVLLTVIAIALPILLERPQDSLIVLSSIALGVNMGGYGAEIVRGAIQAIPRGQTEATIALNLSKSQRLRHVVLPQAMRLILPPMGNLTIEILKGTALVSLVSLSDLMQMTRNITQQQIAARDAGGIVTLYLNVLVIYFVMAQIINGIFRLLERRMERRYAGGAVITDPLGTSDIGAALEEKA